MSAFLILGVGGGSVGAGAPTDPNFANVVLLALNESGTDGGTTFDDQSNSNHTLTANGNFQWDTASAPTGLTSSGLSDGSGDYLAAASHADFSLGAGDFTIEGFFNYSATSGTQVLFDNRAAGGGGVLIYSDGTNLIYHNTATRISAAVPSAGTWRHWTLCRSGGTSKMFVAGTQHGSDYVEPPHNNAQALIRMGESKDGGASFNGWLASNRLTTGVGRYTANFTPPSLPLPSA